MMKCSIPAQGSLFFFWHSARPPAVGSMYIQTYGETEKLNGASRWNIWSITKTEIFTKYTLSFHGGQGFIFLLSSTSDIYLLQECRCRHFIREMRLSLLHYPARHSKYSTEKKPSIKPACGWEDIKIRNDYRRVSNEGVIKNQFSYPRLYGVGIRKDNSTLTIDASVLSETLVPVYKTTPWYIPEAPSFQEENSLEIKFISVSIDKI